MKGHGITIFKRLEKMSFIVDKCSRYIVIFLMVCMVLVVTINIFNRFIFKIPIAWCEELARYLLIYICMIASGIALREGSHASVSFILNKFGKYKQMVLKINIVLILGFLCIVAVFGIRMCLSQFHQVSSGLRISMSIVYTSIPLGSLIMILHSITLWSKLYNKTDSLEIF